MTHDFQRQRVYNWENKNVHDRPQKLFDFPEIQKYVNFVWHDMGLVHPPKVVPMNTRVTRWAGTANRIEIDLPEKEKSTQGTILHEIAHSMTSGVGGLTHQHDSRYVGVYMELLIKYMGFDRFFLWYSAEKEKVQFEKFSKPAIVNSDCTVYDD
jgi:hypothetical protein